MAYNNDYVFTRPYKADGTPTLWKQVVDYVTINGPVSKKEIVKNVWGRTAEGCVVRGWFSVMFARINELNPCGVFYDPNIRKWRTKNQIMSTKNQPVKTQSSHVACSIPKVNVSKPMCKPMDAKDIVMATENFLRSIDEHNERKSWENMKVLVENYAENYSSVTVMYRGARFKFVDETTSSNHYAYIYRMTTNGDWALLYNQNEIPNIIRICPWDNTNHLSQSKVNIDTMKRFIAKVF